MDINPTQAFCHQLRNKNFQFFQQILSDRAPKIISLKTFRFQWRGGGHCRVGAIHSQVEEEGGRVCTGMTAFPITLDDEA